MRRYIAILLILSCCLITGNPGISARQTDDMKTDKPAVSADGSKWRIAYCESEYFITYAYTLAAVVKGLEEIGWVTDLDGFDQVVDSEDSKTIWKWLCSKEVSPYIEFVDDGFYNLREPDTDREAIIKRLNDQNDIDIMLVMGGEAGAFLSKSPHNTNIFVFAASNAVRSGIITSVEDSGRDNVWAHMDEQRFVRQTGAFYDIVKFKKLGMVYEDSDNARVYSAVNEVESLAREMGFQTSL